jgi:DNA-directed RNA polymerase subunit M/transcription elongation factor TFIIS
MDEYTKECIRWLVENNKELLIQYLNTVSKSSVVSVSSVDEAEQIISGAFVDKQVENGMKCKNCGKNTVTFIEVQTRSADEGASVFYSCTNCHAKWKQR